MDLVSFLELTKKSAELPNSFIVYFSAKIKQELFLMQLFNYYKTLGFHQISSINIQDMNFDEIQFNLTSSFLSSKSIYFIKDFDLANTNLKSNLLNFFKNYTGPNLIFFLDTAKHAILQNLNSVLCVDLPDQINLEINVALHNFFYPQYIFDPLFITKALQKQNNLSIDQALILMQYQISLGRKFDNFFEIYLEKIIPSDKSLFLLSQHFFSQDFKEFFNYWQEIKADYPEEFWIPYFSEQIWQASIFIHTLNTLGLIEAKKSAYRLPFSFINKHYKNFNFSFLSKAHDDLYFLDYNFKNGVTQIGLDVWLTKFITKQFN